jgi:hypothetical protein
MSGYVRPVTLEESLSYYKDIKRKRMDLLKKKYQPKVIEWSFQPEINKKSRDLTVQDKT